VCSGGQRGGRGSEVEEGIANATRIVLGKDLEKTWNERRVLLILYVLLHYHYYALPLLHTKGGCRYFIKDRIKKTTTSRNSSKKRRRQTKSEICM
jgi:hypothetical protein